jgi:hypothetical protein
MIIDEGRTLDSLYNYITNYNQDPQFDDVLDYDRLSDVSTFIRDNFFNIIQHGLLNHKCYLSINLKLSIFLNYVKNIEFNKKSIILVSDDTPLSFHDFNNKTCRLVHNNTDVQKLLSLNPFSELPYLSDDEFNLLLKNAIEVVKTLELFE